MNVVYCFASAKGDVSPDDQTLARPFIVPPVQPHAFMTLGDFFASVKDFILREKGEPLASLLSHLWGQPVSPTDVTDIIIRYEKYGTLYQVCSVDVSALRQKAMFVTSTAISSLAKEALGHEFDLLQKLHSKQTPSYLPHVYWKDSVIIRKEDKTEVLLMSLSEWFRGYHEWHFSRDEQGNENVIIWDLVGGYRLASDQEIYEIIRQSSKILTLHYDARTSERIYPWHHGAGDFVVKTDEGMPEIKLITARDYLPLKFHGGAEQPEPLAALTLFFLELSVKMRLDKKEGMGESVCAGEHVLPAVLAGFQEALRLRVLVDPDTVRVDEFMSYMKSLGTAGIKDMLRAYLHEWRLHDESDYAAFTPELDSHVEAVVRLFR